MTQTALLRRACLGVLLALVGTVTVATRVAADPFGPSASPPQYVADSSDHWYCFDSSVPSGDRQKYTDSMNYLANNTNMSAVFTSACGTSTDVLFIRDDTMTGIRGATTCAHVAGLGACDQFWVQINNAQILTETGTCDTSPPDQAANFSVNFIKTIRHEVGHTTGLVHGPSGTCAGPGVRSDAGGADAMASGWTPTNLVYDSYNAHHIAHINAQYH